VKHNGKKISDRLDHTNLPDPLIETFRFMQKEINELRAELELLKSKDADANNEPVIQSAYDKQRS
jgi:serine O-acetyltransferase